MRRLPGLISVAATLLACATPPAAGPATTTAVAAPAAIVELATPGTPAEAGVLIGEVGERLRRDDRPAAIARLTAVLRSDFLTDHGRAGLYWLLAQASDGVDDDRRRDALGGYLVAASLLPPDPELVSRTRKARGALLAMKVEQQALGRTPTQAILVPTHTDADIVVAALSCGQAGDGRYVERRLPGTFRGEALEPRRLLCSENGDELTLWFRVEP
jgi:hypothetical protein